MSVHTSPVTLDKIAAFQKRRRRLIGLRGLCAVIMSSLLIMTGLALVDRFVILPDKLRWSLSLLGYGGVALLFHRVCLRLIIHRTDKREIARMIEHTDPELREDLLSAVELGGSGCDQDARLDSAQFREKLQESVAGRVAKVDVQTLLPGEIIRFWTRAAIGAGILVLLLSLVPGLHFPQLFGRALLPGFNLARPSSIKINFEKPSPPDQIVPSGDSVDLVVGIAGDDVRKVYLETIVDGAPAERTELDRSQGNRFSGSIAVARQDVRYRVRAGGAISRYHKLESRPRPCVNEFQKTYYYPFYTGLGEIHVTEEHGDISALEDSLVKLRLAANQKITTAELRLAGENKKVEPKTIPLAPDPEDATVLVGEIPITPEYTVYRVHLVADESGFTNKFSPEYEIRAVPDLVPSLEITQPESNTEVRTSDTIALRGTAMDDVSLAEIRQAWRINKGAWNEFTLIENPDAPEVDVVNDWELRSLPLRPGDVLVAKLIALDTKGNRGESTPLRLSIALNDDATERKQWAQLERELADDLQQLREEVRKTAHKTAEAQKVVDKDPGQRKLDDRQKLVGAKAAAEDALERAELAQEAVLDALARAPSRPEAEELEAIARALADVKNQNLERVDKLLEAALENKPVPDGKDNSGQKPENLGWEANHIAEQIARAADAFAAEDTADTLADDLGHLAEEQGKATEALRETGSDKGKLDDAIEDQQMAKHKAEAAQNQFEELAEVTESGERNLARSQARKLQESIDDLSEAIAAEQPGSELPQAARQLEQQVDEATDKIEKLENQLARNADKAREELFKNVQEPSEAVEEAKWQAEQLAHRRQQLENERNEERARELGEQIAHAQEQLAEKLEAVAEQLKDSAEAEQANPFADRQLARGHARGRRGRRRTRRRRRQCPKRPNRSRNSPKAFRTFTRPSKPSRRARAWTKSPRLSTNSNMPRASPNAPNALNAPRNARRAQRRTPGGNGPQRPGSN